MTQHAVPEREGGPAAPLPAVEASDPAVEPPMAAPTHSAQEVIDAIRKPLLVLGRDMIVQTANRAFYSAFQMSRAEVEQRLIYDLESGEWSVPRLRELLEHVWERETVPEDFELQREFPRVGQKTMLFYARRLVHQGSSPHLILLAIEDVTEQRRAEKLVQTYVQKLEWSNRELQDFAYIASHDLQEPLRAIQAFGERLDRRVGENLPEEARDSLGRMLRAAERMRMLINDLLEFSRIATKGRPFTRVDLNEVIRQAEGDLSKRVEETGGTVDMGLLPTIQADATQMRQLMQNLMDNALKYGREGVPPVVAVRGELVFDAGDPGQARAMCRVQVRDNGIGFEEKYAERIFAPFQRLHGRGRYDGTGIGLAICRKIVERHAGRITAESTPGDGSLFTVLIPVEQNDAE